jgi:hypothetical protein
LSKSDRQILLLARGNTIVKNMTAESGASALYTQWISRFGAPKTITRDQPFSKPWLTS